MYKQLFVLFSIVIVAKSQINNSNSRADDYVSLNRRQYASNIRDYDLQMDVFKAKYTARLNTIDTQRDMLEDSLIQSDERLDPLEVLSSFSKQCVVKYRSLIPTIASVKTKINTCVATATNQITTLLATPLSTRNSLQYYYTYNFESDINSCNKTYWSNPTKYNSCVIDTCSTTNAYTRSNQKTFGIYMDASQCTATANVKKALDCSFTVQNSTISSTAEANTLIDRCLQGLDDCSSCNKNLYYCSEVKYMAKSQVDYKSSTSANVFLGQNQASDCLMLQLY